MGTQPRLKLAVASLALVVCLAGCGESDDQKAARAVVRQFYEALKDKDAAAACRLVPPREHRACLSGVQQIFQRVADGTQHDDTDLPMRNVLLILEVAIAR